MRIQVVPLGAGQDVGRSCILVTMGGKSIMLDCGMHAGFQDERRFPDFSYISRTGDFRGKLDCVLISHFHLDHCGALPYFTEMLGYDGPILMTHPTKAICPILLEDYRKVSVEKKGLSNFFTADQIKTCMKKVTTINLHQTHIVEEGLEVKAYYAGHVLGAVMFHIKVGELSVVYTGDYNMTPDRHLGSAWIDKLKPDVLITESTYATMIRESKRTRERSLLKNIHSVVSNGGKVLVPVFALGRAQELFILIETYWERMGLGHIPIYFQAGLTLRANDYYKLFINWTNQKIKDTFVQRNMFDYKFVKPWDRTYLDSPGPMVIFATPAMLNTGASLDIFKKLAPDPKNMVLMPGFCEAGTVGAKVLAGQRAIEVDHSTLQVNLQVKLLSFSAHADAKGIMQLIRQVEPRHVILVHGEKLKMNTLRTRVMQELNIPCYDPANGTTIVIEPKQDIPIEISRELLENALLKVANYLPAFPNNVGQTSDSVLNSEVLAGMLPSREVPIDGVLVFNPGKPIQLLSQVDALKDINVPCQELSYDFKFLFNVITLESKYYFLKKQYPRTQDLAFFLVKTGIVHYFKDIATISTNPGSLKIRSFHLQIPPDSENHLLMSWAYVDEDLAAKIMSIAQETLR